MSNEIILGGVKLSEVKALKEAMQKDAVKFVADGVEEGTKLVAKILEAENSCEVQSLVDKATEIFENVQLVASVTGVLYDIPYYEEYGYDSDEVMSMQLENVSDEWNVDFRKLFKTLEHMESNCRDWYSSTC